MGDDWDDGSVAQSKSSGFGAVSSGFGTGDMRGLGRGKTDDSNNNSSGGFGSGSGGFGSGGGGFGSGNGGFGSGGGGFGTSSFGSSNDNGGGFGSRGGGSKGGSGCFKCGEDGHMSRDCPKSGGGGGGGKGCFKCGEEGHMSRDCPSGGGGGSRGKGCFKCGEEGHMSRDCPNPGAGGGRSGGGGGGKGCFKCGEEGHMSRDCPNPGAGGGRSGAGGGGKGCFKCGEEGHMSRDCPNPGAGGGRSGGGGGGKGCFKCGEEGHMSRDCPSGGGGGAGGSRGKGCFKCGEEGHMSRDCPGAQNGGGGFGGATGGGFGAATGGGFGAATGGGFGAATGGGFGAATGGGFGAASSDEPRGGGFSGGDSAPKKSGCFKCGQDGHISRDCTNEAAATTGPDGEKRAPPYVPPELPDDDESLYATLQKGINFDKYDNIPVECTGRDAPRSGLTSFVNTDLHAMLKENIVKSKYDKPTPIQKWAIPIIMGGRDMMACAQTGSGKTAAFLLPVLTGMLRNGVEGSAFSAVQEPQAIIVGPTRELVTQIYNEARKFSHNTMVRPVVVYGGVTTGYQAREVGKGAHLVVGTAGRLLDFIEKGYISLAKVKYFILDEADRMLDMGFLPSMQKLANNLGMPPKTERQTLMFSATFPEEVQQLARELLNDYIFVTVGRVGGANTDIEQHVIKVDQFSKRDQLVSILNAQGSQRTLVFVETKRQADFLASFLSQSEFPTTSIHGDREQREREEALRDFKKGTAPILVATSVAARGLDIPGVNHVINFDMPSSIDEYVHRIGRTGRCGNLGRATSFFNPENDGALARPLVKVLVDAQQEIPDWLEQQAGDSHGSGGFTSGSSQFKDTRRGNFGGGGDSVASAPAAAGGGDEWD